MYQIEYRTEHDTEIAWAYNDGRGTWYNESGKVCHDDQVIRKELCQLEPFEPTSDFSL